MEQIGWLVGRLVGWLVGCFGGWLTRWLLVKYFLVKYLSGWDPENFSLHSLTTGTWKLVGSLQKSWQNQNKDCLVLSMKKCLSCRWKMFCFVLSVVYFTSFWVLVELLFFSLFQMKIINHQFWSFLSILNFFKWNQSKTDKKHWKK